MKIQVLTDLHREFYTNINWEPKISSRADLLVFAGDIHTSYEGIKEYFQKVRTQTKAPILYVLGNHEYYGHSFTTAARMYNKVLEPIPETTILDNFVYKVEDIVILGTTLWTDFNKERDIVAALQGLNDFRVIRANTENYDPVTPVTIIKKYNQNKDWLKENLEKYSDKKIIVVTHHVPSYRLIHRHFKGSSLNGAFVVDMEDMINQYQPKYWLCGHVHNFFDIQLGKTRVIVNPVGYPHENKTGYKENFLIEV